MLDGGREFGDAALASWIDGHDGHTEGCGECTYVDLRPAARGNIGHGQCDDDPQRTFPQLGDEIQRTREVRGVGGDDGDIGHLALGDFDEQLTSECLVG